MPAVPLFLCPRLLVRPTAARITQRAAALSTSARCLASPPPPPNAEPPVPPPILTGELGRPHPTPATAPPISIPHHDAVTPDSSAAASSETESGEQPRRYSSGLESKPSKKHEGKRYPYYIARTRWGSEPVYEDYVRKTMERTLIRLIHGNSEKLRKDLLETLFKPLGWDDSKLKSQVRMPGHVEFRGHWRAHIVGWMRERGL